MHVAVSGKIASGKDTAAKMIADALKPLGRRTRIIKFADALYSLCARYDGALDWTVDGWEPRDELSYKEKSYVTAVFFDQCVHQGVIANEQWTEEIHKHVTELAHTYPTTKGVKNRERLREVAEYCRAAIDPNFWVRLSEQQFKSGHLAGYTMIYSDLRMPHEAAWCEQQDLLRLRIDVSPELQKMRMLALGMRYDPAALASYTEVALDDYAGFHQRIQNDGTYEELNEQIGNFIRSQLLYNHQLAG